LNYKSDRITATNQYYLCFNINIMSVTIPVDLNGNEYISEVVSSKNTVTNHIEYFIKINGDPACFVNFEHTDISGLREESSSPDLTVEFKEAVKKALREYLHTIE